MASRTPRGAGTKFRKLCDAGSLPVRLNHGGSGGSGVAWKTDPRHVDVEAFLPLFFEGVMETEHPYRTLAVRGAEELVRACEEEDLLAAIPRLVMPMKRTLDGGAPAAVAATLDLLRKLTHAGPNVGSALVPYYRQLLPAFNAYRNRGDVFVSLSDLRDGHHWREQRVGDQSLVIEGAEVIGRGRSKRCLASLVLRTLRALEATGGGDSLPVIKYMVPSYRSISA